MRQIHSFKTHLIILLTIMASYLTCLYFSVRWVRPGENGRFPLTGYEFDTTYWSKQKRNLTEVKTNPTFEQDLKFVPANAIAMAVIRPASIMELDQVKTIPGVDFGGANPFRPSEVIRAVVVIFPEVEDRGHDERHQVTINFGLIVQLNREIDKLELARRFNPKAEKDRFDDKLYITEGMYLSGISVGYPDDNTALISSSYDFVFNGTINAPKNKTGTRLVNLVNRLNPDSHFYLALDNDHLQRTLERASMFSSENVVDHSWFYNLKSITASLQLEQPDGFQAQLETGSRKKGLNEAVTRIKELLTDYEISEDSLFDENDTKNKTLVANAYSTIKDLVDELAFDIKSDTLEIKSKKLPSSQRLLELVASGIIVQRAASRDFANRVEYLQNMQRISAAIAQYRSEHNQNPTDILDDDGKPLLSWRVRILPYLRENVAFAAIKKEEAWDSESNKKILRWMPKVFGPNKNKKGLTHFKFVNNAVTTASDIDIAKYQKTKTVELIDASNPVEWTRPGDVIFDPDQPANEIKAIGSFACLSDFTTITIPKSTGPLILKQLFDGTADSKTLAKFSQPYRTVSSADAKPYPSNEMVDIALKDLNSQDEQKVIEALQRIAEFTVMGREPRWQKVIDRCTQLLDSDSSAIACNAVFAINNCLRGGDVDPAAMIKQLYSPYDVVRWSAIETLADMRSPVLLRGFVGLPQGDQSMLRQHLIEQMASVAVDASLPTLYSEDPVQRQMAIALIAEYGGLKYKDLLQSMTKDPEEFVSEFAEQALEWIQEKTTLQSALEQNEGNLVEALESLKYQLALSRDGGLEAIAPPFGSSDNKKLAMVDFDHLTDMPNLVHLEIGFSKVPVEFLAKLNAPKLKTIDIGHCRLIDDQITGALLKFQMLESFDAADTAVGDETAKALANLKQLSNIDLSGTMITDKGVEQLLTLKNLEIIDLSDTRITDRSIELLSKLPYLKMISVRNTCVTDAGFAHTKKMKRLQNFNVNGTHVTAKAREKREATLRKPDFLLDY